jgi:succinate dehydrogenase / fumarate reductase membrane anchor subunit
VRLFQLQRISAIALLVFLTIHMMVLHYPPFHIDFSRIIERMADPLWKAIDIAFLFFVLVHALAGMHAVVTDFDAATRWQKVHAAALAVFGIAAFLYGTATILAFQPPV